MRDYPIAVYFMPEPVGSAGVEVRDVQLEEASQVVLRAVVERVEVRAALRGLRTPSPHGGGCCVQMVDRATCLSGNRDRQYKVIDLAKRRFIRLYYIQNCCRCLLLRTT